MAARKQGARNVDAFPAEGRARAVIEAITPQVDGGRFAVKRIVGDRVVVEADCFADGHDVLACRLRFRRDDDAAWNEVPMAAIGNDRWRGDFVAADVGRYRYTVSAWVDAFLSWRHDFERRVDADDMRVAAQVGADIVTAAATRARGDERKRLTAWARALRDTAEVDALRDIALDDMRAALAQRYPDRRFETTFPVELPLVVDRPRAGCSSWYELFPRSTAQREHVHGTFADCEARLP